MTVNATRELVLDCFDAVVLERGTLTATLQEGVDAAGLTTGVIYHHFKDKLDLLCCLFRRYVERQRQLIESAQTVTEVVQGLRVLGAANPGAARLDYELSANDHVRALRRARRLFVAQNLNRLASSPADDPRGVALADGSLNLVRSDRLRWSGSVARDDLVADLVRLFDSNDCLSVSAKHHDCVRGLPGEQVRYFDWMPKSGRVAPTTKRGEKQRRAILAAAAESLGRAGITGLTIPAVATRADVSPATVYRYFRDAMDIFEALLPEAETAILHARQSVWGGDLDMVAGLHSYQTLVRAHRGVFRGWLDVIESDPSSNARFAQSRRDFVCEVTEKFGGGYAGPIEAMLLLIEGHVWETIVYGRSTCHVDELARMAAKFSH